MDLLLLAPEGAEDAAPPTDHIHDARWVVEQCLQRVQASADAQRRVLELALTLSGAALGLPDSAGGDEGDSSRSRSGSEGAPLPPPAASDAERAWWEGARLRVLQHLDRLDTAVALAKG